MKSRKVQLLVLSALVIGPLVCPQLSADPVTIDEIVYQSSPGLDPAGLEGTADFSLVGNTLTIVLTNTSANLGGTLDAPKLLAGIGFNLPAGVSITGGTADWAGTATLVNFPAILPSNLDEFWGWDGANAPFGFGNYLQLGTVNTSVSTLESTHSTNFDGSANLDGPSYGLLSKNQLSFGSGQAAIIDQIIIALTLDLGSYTGDLVGFIDDGHVALAFGSPDGSRTNVPEPMTLLLLGTGIVGIGILRRRSS